MKQLSEFPALHQLLTTEDWGVAPNGCGRCPFASPDPKHDYFDDYGVRVPGGINTMDTDEGYYICDLLDKSGIWGENPDCTLRDWQARALLEMERSGMVTNGQQTDDWHTEMVSVLQTLWPVDSPLTVVVAPSEHIVWQMRPTADGACNIRPNGEIVIYLRPEATDTEYWRDTLLHEYTHAAMAGVLPKDPDEDTRQRFEIVTTRIAGLLDYAVRTGARQRA